MVNDIADAAEAILVALNKNTVFPESLSRRFSLVQGYDVQHDCLQAGRSNRDPGCGSRRWEARFAEMA